MDEIKRYTPHLNHSEFIGMKAIRNGEWVDYEDHKETVDALKKELEEARERYVQLWTRANYR